MSKLIVKKEDPELLTVDEAARIRGVVPSAIRNLVYRGRLASVRLYGRMLLYRAEVEGFEMEKPGPKGTKKGTTKKGQKS